MSGLTHIDAEGRARMVDVSDKAATDREAVAEGYVRLAPETLALALSGQARKGDVRAVAEIAGVMGAKRTSDLIPMCHALSLTHCDVDLVIPPSRDRIDITATARVTAGTGVEMEALCAVSIAALTLYDMCKAVDKGMVVSDVRLVRKSKLPPAP